MEQERSIDKLARYTMYAATIIIIAAICYLLRSIIAYILLAAVVSLICRPLMNLMKKITYKGKSAPDWLLAIISLILVLGLLVALLSRLIPVIINIASNISDNFSNATGSSQFSDLIDNLDFWLVSTFPSLGPGFSLEETLVDFFSKQFSLSSLTSVLGSVASAAGTTVIAIFSMVFIGFFFLKDQNLFKKMIASLVPDKEEQKTVETIGEVEGLVSRYFVGLILEVLCVALLNFLGLSLVCKLDVSSALGIAFMTGVLNVIPYLGPWIGGAIGTVLGLVLKYSSAAALGTELNFWPVLIALIACFVFTQMVDNFVLQPLIYSKSIKAHPLEIFIVLLVAGSLGGIIGMLVAIPAYTVVRVIAAKFLPNVKFISRLLA